jgi:hypothetical protein
LITLSGLALRVAPGLVCAAFPAVDIAAIATGADEHLIAAARAQIQARGCISLFGFVTQTWTKRAASGILLRHSCPARVWGAAPMQTCRLWIGAEPVFNEDKSLTHPQLFTL